MKKEKGGKKLSAPAVSKGQGEYFSEWERVERKNKLQGQKNAVHA